MTTGFRVGTTYPRLAAGASFPRRAFLGGTRLYDDAPALTPPRANDLRGVTTPFHGRWRGPFNTGLANPELVPTQAEDGFIVSTANEVIENRHFRGTLDIRASGVIVRNCKFTNHYGGILYLLMIGAAGAGAVVEDCFFDAGTRQASVAVDIGQGATLRRCDIRSGSDQVRLANNALLEDCYIGHSVYFPGAHADVLQSLGGSNVTVRRCNLVCVDDLDVTSNRAFQGGGTLTNYLFEDNYFDGGAYAIGTDQLVLRRNRFSGRHYYSAYTGPDPNAGLAVEDLNVYDLTGEPI